MPGTKESTAAPPFVTTVTNCSSLDFVFKSFAFDFSGSFTFFVSATGYGALTVLLSFDLAFDKDLSTLSAGLGEGDFAPLIFLAGGEATGDGPLLPLFCFGYGLAATTGVGFDFDFFPLSLSGVAFFFVSTDFALQADLPLEADFGGSATFALALSLLTFSAFRSFFFFGGIDIYVYSNYCDKICIFNDKSDKLYNICALIANLNNYLNKK